MICAAGTAFKSGKLGKGKASAVPPYSSLVVTINHSGHWSRRNQSLARHPSTPNHREMVVFEIVNR
jgi:hypothetical protein